jgi:hypothetical protein
MDYPRYILNTPLLQKALQNIFKHNSRYYDLDEYEKVSPGAGKRIWQMIQSEIRHQQFMKSESVRLDALIATNNAPSLLDRAIGAINCVIRKHKLFRNW